MAPGFKNIGTKIVNSWPGSGTADTIYQTEDGRTWLYNPCITPARVNGTCSSGVGRIIGDHIVSVP